MTIGRVYYKESEMVRFFATFKMIATMKKTTANV